MSVSFCQLSIGKTYTRKDLADLWGYASYHAIGRGVVTPAGTPYVIIFVQREKRSTDTQYEDRLVDGVLHWEGEEGHGNDARILAAQKTGEEIHLFYRDLHVQPFTYHGRIQLTSQRMMTDRPSQFTFRVGGA